MSSPRAAYIHIPFCKHHCGYCDFAVVAGQDHLQNLYLEALEIELASLNISRSVDTIFIGGGTPTYLSALQLARLMAMIRKWFSDETEFSIEATPESINEEKLQVLKAVGVNRVSLGVQSFQSHLLNSLERVHAVDELEPAIRLCQRYFDRVSLDLIFAVPGQTLAEWQADLERAIAFGVDHISTYGLTFEKGTPLWKKRERQQIQQLDEDLELAMYEHAMDRLPAAGIEQYEISNFAKPGCECRHNQIYWANEGYYGFGLGAVRYIDGRRETNTRSLDTYTRKLFAGESPTQNAETLTAKEMAQETIFTQLRRREGIGRESFQKRTGMDLDELAGARLQRMIDAGMIADDGRSIRLTRKGKCVADTVMAELMAG